MLTIDEVVRCTGLTSRALRFYEARGLISPLRTSAGRRLFGAGELEAVHRIVALKRAGLRLGDIKRLFDRKPVDLAALLTAQRERLTQQAADMAEATALIDTALSRIGRGKPLDAATLCALIRDRDRLMASDEAAWKSVIDRFYPPEALAEWDRTIAPHARELNQQAYHDRWKELGDRIAAALPLDPQSDAALAFVREWFALLAPFSKVASPAIWEASRQLYDRMPEWEGEADAGFSPAVWVFIQDSTARAMAKGADVGTVPPWFATITKGDAA